MIFVVIVRVLARIPRGNTRILLILTGLLLVFGTFGIERDGENVINPPPDPPFEHDDFRLVMAEHSPNLGDGP